MSRGQSIPKPTASRGEGAPRCSPCLAMPWDQSAAATPPHPPAPALVIKCNPAEFHPAATAVASGGWCGLLMAVLRFQTTTRVFHPLLISVRFPPQSLPPVCPERGRQPHAQPGTLAVMSLGVPKHS